MKRDTNMHMNANANVYVNGAQYIHAVAGLPSNSLHDIRDNDLHCHCGSGTCVAETRAKKPKVGPTAHETKEI